MSRVLVTGGAGTIGAAVVRRLLRDPDFEVRVSDQREAPDWMREGCEIHRGDLRELDQARKAIKGCTHVIHLAAIVGGIANFHKLPYTLSEVNSALYNAIFRAAIEAGVERFTYVSSSMVFENATQYPTREDYLPECPVPPDGFVFPVVEYRHSEGCSVTGGFVYRGCTLPDLHGTYFYGDYCRAFVRSFVQRDGRATDERDWTQELRSEGTPAIASISSFGEDTRGEIYIVDLRGMLFKLVSLP